jgi:hypothetical protein
LTLHEAGHLLYRDGEYAAALTCMERSAKRGNLWVDRDTVVVNEAWEIADNALKGLAGDPVPQPNVNGSPLCLYKIQGASHNFCGATLVADDSGIDYGFAAKRSTDDERPISSWPNCHGWGMGDIPHIHFREGIVNARYTCIPTW